MAESSSVTSLENDSKLSKIDSTEHSESPKTEVNDSDELFEMYCEDCNRDGTRVTAHAFCLSCVEYLCPTCLKYHRKFLPGHKSLEGDKMPLDICIEKCQAHNNEIIKFYCTTCSKFVCSVCKTEHQTGTCSMKYLTDIVKDLEKGDDFKELITNKNDIAEQLTGTKALINEKYKSVDSTTAEAISVIKKEKEALFAEFDQEVFRIEENIQVEKKQDNMRVDSVIENFDSLDREIDHLTDNIKNLPLGNKTRKYKLFMELKQLCNKLKQLKDSVECLKKDLSTIDDAFESELTVQATDLIEKVTKFGTMIRSYNVNIEKGNDDTEPMKIACPFADINLRARSDLNDCLIVDCCFLSEKYFIACDKGNRSLKLVDTKSKGLIYVRPVKTVPECVTKINDTQIAMVQPYDKDQSIIQFLNVTRAKTLTFNKRYILTEMYCYDIAYIKNDRLIISMSACHEGKVQILSLTGKVLANIEKDNEGEQLFSCPYWISLDATGTRLYVSDWYNDNITEIDIDNQVNRTLSHHFWHPKGITTDKEGFVYVCEEGTGRVKVFNPDESGIFVLLDNQSLNWQPCSLCFSRTDNKLYVSQVDQDCIKVYKITDSKSTNKK